MGIHLRKYGDIWFFFLAAFKIRMGIMERECETWRKTIGKPWENGGLCNGKSMGLPSGQTWRAGKWTIEMGEFPINTSIYSGFFHPAMFDDTSMAFYAQLEMNRISL